MRTVIPFWYFYFFMATAAVFLLFPGLDIFVSSLFYREGAGFFMKKWWPFQAVYYGVNYLSIIVPALLTGYIIYVSITKKTIKNIPRKAAAYLLIVLMLGPGLMVTETFKNTIGRARPDHIVQFGGTKDFSPALTPSDQCTKNCSFVSGHGSFGFYFLALSFIAAKAYRRKFFIFGISTGVICAITRIVQGRHFLSDNIFAFLIVFLVARLVHEIMYYREIQEELELENI